jgi:hypothetical protein
MVNITLSVTEAEGLRLWLVRLMDGRPVHLYPELIPVFAAFDAQGVGAPARVKCPDCRLEMGSEDELYEHLVHREIYPYEDAGVAASQAWRNR